MQRKWWIACCLVGFCTIVAYWNAVGTPFQFDDKEYVLHNPHFADVLDVRRVMQFNPEMPRPVSNMTAAVLVNLFGPDPAGYHVFNIILHILNAILVGLLAMRLLAGRAVSGKEYAVFIATASIMALHPLLTGGVTYISNLPGLEASFFMLLGALLYKGSRERYLESRPFMLMYVVAVISGLLALGAKEIALVFPALVFLVDVTGENVNWKKIIKLEAPIWGLWLSAVIVRILSGVPLLPVGARTGLVEYVKIQLALIPDEIALILWPVNLNMDRFVPSGYGEGAAVMVGALILVAAVAIFLLMAFRCRYALCFGLGFILINMAPFFVVPLKDPMVERNLYLPVAGVAILLGSWLGKHNRVRFRKVGLAVLLMALTGLTVARNNDWKSEEGLWRDVYLKSPDNPRALNYLGALLIEQGELDRADYLIVRAIRMAPKYAEAINNRGVIYMRQGKHEMALQQFDLSSRCDREFFDPRYNMGALLVKLERFDEAENWFKQALKLSPDNSRAVEALSQLGLMHLQKGRYNQSLEVFEYLHKTQSTSLEVTLRLATSYEAVGRFKDAGRFYEEALHLPGSEKLRVEIQNALNKVKAKSEKK